MFVYVCLCYRTVMCESVVYVKFIVHGEICYVFFFIFHSSPFLFPFIMFLFHFSFLFLSLLPFVVFLSHFYFRFHHITFSLLFYLPLLPFIMFPYSFFLSLARCLHKPHGSLLIISFTMANIGDYEYQHTHDVFFYIILIIYFFLL